MSGPLELAWMLLKANMPPFVPRKIDDQLGIGSYRAAYRLPGVGHTTKYGTGEKLAEKVGDTREKKEGSEMKTTVEGDHMQKEKEDNETIMAA